MVCERADGLLTDPMSASASALGTRLPPALYEVVLGFQARRAKTTADKSLCRRIRDGIRQMEDPPSGLAFQIHDGAVSIYGVVPSAARREAILAVAATQPGVRRIVDHLSITGA